MRDDCWLKPQNSFENIRKFLKSQENLETKQKARPFIQVTVDQVTESEGQSQESQRKQNNTTDDEKSEDGGFMHSSNLNLSEQVAQIAKEVT